MSALTKTTKKEIKAAMDAGWKTYKTAMQNSKRSKKTTVQNTWSSYRTELRACKGEASHSLMQERGGIDLE